MHEPDKIMAAAAELLDYTQPIALILSDIMGHVVDTDEAHSIVARLLDTLPTGSYLSLNDGTSVVAYKLRTSEEIANFFDGLELLEPGVVSCPQWRPDADTSGPAEVDAFGGVGRKP